MSAQAVCYAGRNEPLSKSGDCESAAETGTALAGAGSRAVAAWDRPIASSVGDLVSRELPADFARNDPCVWIGVLTAMLTLIAFGLLGLAAWHKSQLVAAAGLIAVGVFVVVEFRAFLLNLVP